MAESQATRKPTTLKKSISSAAKRPQKTQKFLDDIGQVLYDFDDEFSLLPVNNGRSHITILPRTTGTHSPPSGPKRLMPV